MMVLFQIGLLLIGICIHVGFDTPWHIALFPFYMPPIVVGLSVLAFRYFHII